MGSFCFCFFLFSFIFISWRLITLQYCSGFCHTLTWISHGFTCVPHPNPCSRLPPHPIPLDLPCNSPEHLSHASNLGWFQNWSRDSFQWKIKLFYFLNWEIESVYFIVKIKFQKMVKLMNCRSLSGWKIILVKVQGGIIWKKA